MIRIECDKSELEYDVFSLVKAFFPKENVNFAKEDETDEANEEIRTFRMTVAEKNVSIDFEGMSFTGEIRETSRSNYKNEIKKIIYKALHEVTGNSLPWGNLTGIRPVKIATGLLEEGASDEEIAEFLAKDHFVSEEKIHLGIDIAKREKQILSGLDYENGYSLYIGIPFCPTRCLYCSFTSNSYDTYKSEISHYLDCLEKEMDYVRDDFAGKVLNTVYIGGGTPTALNADELDRLLSAVKNHFDFSNCLEFTVEAGRPDSITTDKLRVLKKYGVTRISVNPQTMNDETLEIIGRKHTTAQTVEAFNLARSEGFDNINMDIIIGLPGETDAHVSTTIDEIVRLSPDSLTVHSLAIKRASKMNEWIDANGRDSLSDAGEMMKIASAGADRIGLKPYYLYRQKNMSGNLENVGFAEEGKFGIYNILIMEEVQSIVALGAGTVTKRVFRDGRIERCDNVKDLKLYMEKIDEMIDRKKVLFGAG